MWPGATDLGPLRVTICGCQAVTKIYRQEWNQSRIEVETKFAIENLVKFATVTATLITNLETELKRVRPIATLMTGFFSDRKFYKQLYLLSLDLAVVNLVAYHISD